MYMLTNCKSENFEHSAHASTGPVYLQHLLLLISQAQHNYIPYVAINPEKRCKLNIAIFLAQKIHKNH